MIRNTKGLSLITAIIKSAPRPIASSEVLLKVRTSKNPLDRATVFRIINRLLEKGDIYEVNLGDGKKRYEWHGEHHHHLVCIKCRSITPVHTCGAEKLAEHEARRVGFQLRSHSLEYFGLCSKCR